jgi:hypothetical protein
MPFNINEFSSQGLTQGGARASQFLVIMPTPLKSGAAESKLSFTCRAAQIPPSIVDAIPVAYFGRTVKYAGDRPNFPDWSVQVMNDEDFAVRGLMERWHNEINTLIGNRRGSVFSQNIEGYKTDAVVRQYGKNGAILREYTFYGLFPTAVEGIDLSWDAQNVIENFRCYFLV